MHPFRSRADELAEPLRTSEVVRDAVGTMVKQFADPLALLRELVQNSIDAGATRVDVRLSFDDEGAGAGGASDEPAGEGSEGASDEPASRRRRERARAREGVLRVVVADDGCGMSLGTIEGCLLTLFRSSKDGDKSKIGKFGVGFFSVLALEPELVRVDTGDGTATHRLTLRPDYTYEIEQLAKGPRGTAVALRVRCAPERAKELALRARAALARWCPHVALPLHAASLVPGARYDERVDAPLAVPPEGVRAAVTHRDDDGAVFALALRGPLAPALPGVGLYKRGLLLHELAEPLVPGVVARVDAPGLAHTISRDDVRRDAAFARTMARGVELANTALRAAALASFATHARAAAALRAQGKPVGEHGGALRDLALGLTRAYPTLPREALPWPLVSPLGAKSCTDAGAPAPRWAARSADALTRALANRGEPVVDLGAAESDEGAAALAALHARVRGVDAGGADPRGRLCAPCVRAEAECTDEERALLAALRPMALAAGVRAVGLCVPVGAGSERMFLALAPAALEAPDPSLVLDGADAEAKLFSLLGARGLALNAQHRRVSLALRAAKRDPALAALVLLRAVLLACGKLDGKRDAAVLDAALAPLAVAPREGAR